jgi:hypothetical protein
VFPGFPIFGAQHSKRYTFQTNLRSTFGANLVNEFKVGYTGGATLFSPEIKAQPWGGSSVADQTGFLLGISTANINNTSSGTGYQAREASTNLVENNLNWSKGSHSLTIGGSWTEVDLWLENQTVVPAINFDIVTGDPSNALFSAANFPGSSSDQRADAGDLYAVLTGRVSAINSDIRLNEETDEYELCRGIQRGRMREIGLFVSDSWRLRPNLTLNLGLRHELQLRSTAEQQLLTATPADICGVSVAIGQQPVPAGLMPGKKPNIPFNKGTSLTRRIGTTSPSTLPLPDTEPSRRVPSDPVRPRGDSIRAGYSLAYSRNGTSDFSGVLGANPGVAVAVNRSTSLTGSNALNNDGRGLPLMFRDRDRLSTPTFPLTRVYPLTDVITGDVQIFDPGIAVPYAQTWTAGWQRKLTRDMAVEIRYVGTRADQGWTTYNYNEANIVENRFLDEFRLAQQNLRAHVALGCGAEGQPDCSFAYRGPGTGTSPLPINLAYLNGRTNADSASAYTGSAWTSSNWIDPLNPTIRIRSPGRDQLEHRLDGSSTCRSNAALAGCQPTSSVQPGSTGRRHRDRQRAVDAVSRDAARAHQTAIERIAGPGQLCVWRGAGERAPLVSNAADVAARHGRRGRRNSRLQDQLGLRASVRAGPPFRQQRRPVARPVDRRLVARWHRAHPEREDARLRQRPADGHDEGRRDEDVQAAVRQRQPPHLHAAAGRRRQYGQSIQRGCHVSDRLRRSRSA